MILDKVCTAHGQIHCIKEWRNLKAARSSSGGVALNNSLCTAHAQIHCIKELSNLKAARSSSGGVGLNNSLLCTAHAQIYCIKEWSNLKAARSSSEGVQPFASPLDSVFMRMRSCLLWESLNLISVMHKYGRY